MPDPDLRMVRYFCPRCRDRIVGSEHQAANQIPCVDCITPDEEASL